MSGALRSYTVLMESTVLQMCFLQGSYTILSIRWLVKVEWWVDEVKGGANVIIREVASCVCNTALIGIYSTFHTVSRNITWRECRMQINPSHDYKAL